MAGLTFRDMMVKGSALGAIIAVPTVAIFLALWYVTGDMLIPAVVGAAVHFVALLFAFRLAKRILVKGSKENGSK